MKQLQQQAQIIFLMMSLFLGVFSLEVAAQCTSYFETEQIPLSPALEGYAFYDNIHSVEHREFYIFSDYQSPESRVLVEYDGEKLEKIAPFPTDYANDGFSGYLVFEGQDGSKYFALQKDFNDFLNNKYYYFKFDATGHTFLDSYLDEGKCVDKVFDDENGVVYAIGNDCENGDEVLYRLDGNALTPISDINTHGRITKQVYGGADYSLLQSDKGLLIYQNEALTFLVEDEKMGFYTLDIQNNTTSVHNNGKVLFKGGAFRTNPSSHFESVLFTYDGETLTKFPLVNHSGNFDMRIAFEAPNGDIYLSDASRSLHKYDGTSVEKVDFPSEATDYFITSFVSNNIVYNHSFERADGGYYFHMKNFQDNTALPLILEISLNGVMQVINLPSGFTPYRWIEGEKDIAILQDANGLFQFFENDEGSLNPLLPNKYSEAHYHYSDVGRLGSAKNESGERFIIYFSEEETVVFNQFSGSYSLNGILFKDRLIMHGSGNPAYFALNDETELLSEIQPAESHPHILFDLINEHEILLVAANYFSTTYSPQLFRIKETTCEITLPTIEANDFCPGDDLAVDMGDYESKPDYSLQYLLFNGNNNTLVDKNDTGVFPSTDLSLGTYKICAYEEWNHCKSEPSPIGGEINNLNEIGTTESGCSQYVCTENIVLTGGMAEDEESVALTQTGGNLIYTIEICGGVMPYSTDLTASTGFVTPSILPTSNANCRTLKVTYASTATWTLEINDEAACTPLTIASDDLPGEVTLPPQITNPIITQETCPGRKNGAIDITVINGDTECGNYTYDWSGPSGYSATTQDLSNIAAGIYTIVVTDCNNASFTATYNVSRSGLGGRGGRGNRGCKTADDWSSITDLHIAPNPFQSFTQVRFQLSETEKISIQLYDAAGRMVRSVFEGQADAGVDYRMEIPQTATLPQGTYIIQLTMESGETQHSKIVKMQ